MDTRFSPVPNRMDVTIKPHIRPFTDQSGGAGGKFTIINGLRYPDMEETWLD
jgi:hypothetical protein